MKKNSIESRLYSIFEDIFQVDRSELHPGLQRGGIRDWDSLGHVRLITAVEEEFAVKIPASKAAKFKDIRSLTRYLEGRHIKSKPRKYRIG